jgi:hypothetical protein
MTTTFLTDDELKQYILDTCGPDEAEGVFIMDGYPSAAIGLLRHPDGTRLVYSYAKVIHSLVHDHGMTQEDAVEFYDYNIERSLPYLGDQAPLIIEEFAP